MKRFALVVSLILIASASAHAGTVEVPYGCDPVQDHYIVEFHSTSGPAQVDQLIQRLIMLYGGNVHHRYYHALEGLCMETSPSQAALVADHPAVMRVAQSCRGELATTQPNPPWGLDRIDQRDLPIDGGYTFGSEGQDVHVYILDTGVRNLTEEFGSRLETSISVIGGSSDDEWGHGTHVAGIVGSATYGVAKGVTLHSVKVSIDADPAECDVLMGVDWIMENHMDPAVVNMSIAFGVHACLRDAIQESIDDGITYVLGAGNVNCNAQLFLAGSLPDAIVVGATDDADVKADFSNYGPALDLFAPGVDVLSTCPDDLAAFCHLECADGPVADTSFCEGTSMSAPHVAGLAARYLGQNGESLPKKQGLIPSMVEAALVDDATANRLSDLDGPVICGPPPEGAATVESPNLLLYSAFLEGAPDADLALELTETSSRAGATTMLTASVENLGPSPGDATLIVNFYPKWLFEPTLQSGPSCQRLTHHTAIEYHCDLGVLPAAGTDSAIWEVELLDPAGGDLEVTATVGGSVPDRDTANNAQTLTVEF